MSDQGDAGFSAFVEQQRSGLLRTAYLVVGDWTIAEDVVQVALEKLYLSWSRRRGDPLPYARRIVLNSGIDHWRRPSSRREQLVDRELPEVGVPPPDDHVADGLRLADAMRHLPSGQRRVVVAIYYADLSVAQTAKALRLSEGTVKSYLHRARTRLKDLLTPPGPVPAGLPETDRGGRRSHVADR